MASRVLIVDPTPAYRRGLAAALTDAGFGVEEASTLDGSHEASVDVVVVTIRPSDSFEPIAHLISSAGSALVIALVEGRDPEHVADALRGGVSGVVDRDAPPELVSGAIRAAHEGHTVIPRWAAGSFAARIPSRPPSDQWVSEDEVLWLRLLAQGMTVAALADDVGYSEREMFRNLHDLYAQIRVRNRTGALLWADRHGLLATDGADEANTRV